MPRSQRVVLSVEELVASLSHTSLRTVVVEGDTDAIVFRQIETSDAEPISVLPVGGRTVALAVEARRAEYAHAEVAFVVDRDRWVYGALPRGLGKRGIFVTEGYSIENDVILDGDVLRYMTNPERQAYSAELERFIYWYALAVVRNAADPTLTFDNHPAELLDNPLRYQTATALKNGENYPLEFREEISTAPLRLVRGKSLIALICRQIDRSGRHARHSPRTILEVVAHHPGPRLRKIFRNVRKWLTESRE